MNDTAILQSRDLCKTYGEGSLTTEVLVSVDLTVGAGERIAIMGSSGAGKSTLLHLLGGLDVPTKGEVWLQGIAVSSLDERRRGMMRNRLLGFIYQFHHLLPEFTTVENVAMPLLIRGEPPGEAALAAAGRTRDDHDPWFLHRTSVMGARRAQDAAPPHDPRGKPVTKM